MATFSGNEYPAIVEFAPYPRISKKKNKKPDPRKNTIEQGRFVMHYTTGEGLLEVKLSKSANWLNKPVNI